MAWQQIHLQCEKSQVDLAEALFLESGAVSIVLEDAGDQPLFEPLPGESPLWDEVVLTAIFQLADSGTDSSTMSESATSDFEALGQEIATQVHASRVWLTALEDKDWEREWMSHYQPIPCANNLWIVPKWLTPPDSDATNIIMDPGLAFGTGYHATTRLCLDWLTEQPLAGKMVIDYGCGSGILGIAALLLGAEQVLSVDIDPQAVLATKQNAERNKVDDRLRTFLPHEFKHYCDQHDVLPVDMIVANILAKPLMELAPYFATLIKADGKIVLAGLIDSQIEEVIDAYKPYFQLADQHKFTQQEDKHWVRLAGTYIG
ncbi:50S ribosomal protein L11 methyltransferase [Psychrobacter pygoscelis]|uniref:50S ribosomal protein L11 methyltransferase n=1 Tax=Psychrobacter pygoscelis TaxID=2488563 RepID=UPI001038DB11|nr:50S ribosomal protein L11 methyltransferase [Psychrobacter pygoscelis]